MLLLLLNIIVVFATMIDGKNIKKINAQKLIKDQ